MKFFEKGPQSIIAFQGDSAVAGQDTSGHEGVFVADHKGDKLGNVRNISSFGEWLVSLVPCNDALLAVGYK